MIPPGETIGILGGGQLGRMIAMAAAQLGYRCHVYAPEADSVAAEVCGEFTHAAYDDAAALSSPTNSRMSRSRRWAHWAAPRFCPAPALSRWRRTA